MSIPIKRTIANFLLTNKERSYVTIQEIAKHVYGHGYVGRSKKSLDRVIRQNIPHAIALLLENGITIIPVKKRNAETGELSPRVLGYKVAGKEDQATIDMMLEDKENRVNAYLHSMNETITDLSSKKLIDENIERRKQLSLMAGTE